MEKDKGASLPYVVEPMAETDLREVLRIERESFPRPWALGTYRSELTLPYGCYLVVRRVEGQRQEEVAAARRWRFWSAGREGGRAGGRKGPVVAYGGFHAILDEGHITTLAVAPAYRRRAIGSFLLLHLFDEAVRRGVARMTLEVRVSNLAAQQLYRRFGFHVRGRRRRYYGNGEDALVMASDRLDDPAVFRALQERRQEVVQTLSQQSDSQDDEQSAP